MCFSLTLCKQITLYVLRCVWTSALLHYTYFHNLLYFKNIWQAIWEKREKKDHLCKIGHIKWMTQQEHVAKLWLIRNDLTYSHAEVVRSFLTWGNKSLGPSIVCAAFALLPHLSYHKDREVNKPLKLKFAKLSAPPFVNLFFKDSEPPQVPLKSRQLIKYKLRWLKLDTHIWKSWPLTANSY